MVRMPHQFRAIAPDQRGFGAAKAAATIDATKGMGDLADDALGLLDNLEIERTHVVGNSMGGAVVWRLIADAPERVLTATQVAPGSPYGFGGTKTADGEPCWDDFAGSGGGLINPQLVERLAAQDDGMDSPFSPRSILRTLIVVPGSIPENEDALVSAMLSTHLGAADYPGDMVTSPNWPFVAPGTKGVNNALSPKYAGTLVERITGADSKPLVAWIRGEFDKVVGDNASSDPGTLGPLGFIPGWPGQEVYPSQPMLAQTRHVLDEYSRAGGSYTETVIKGTAHVPFIEDPSKFDSVFHAHIENNGGNNT